MPSVSAQQFFQARSRVRARSRARTRPVDDVEGIEGRVLHGEEVSALLPNAPDTSMIEMMVGGVKGIAEHDAETRAQVESLFPGLLSRLGITKFYGNWLGPRSRITRRLAPSVTQGYITHVANVWAIPDTVPAAQRNAEFEVIGRLFSTFLHKQSDDWTTEQMPYNPDIHGTEEWWQSQKAARTHYRDEWPEMSARLAASENPLGPDSPDVRAPTAGEVAGGAAKKIGGSILLIAGAAILALFAWNASQKRKRESENAFWGGYENLAESGEDFEENSGEFFEEYGAESGEDFEENSGEESGEVNAGDFGYV